MSQDDLNKSAQAEEDGQLPPGLDNGGWVKDPEAVEAIRGELPFPSWGATPAAALETLPQEVFGWRLWKEATGTAWPVLDQKQVGSCCSFGASHAVMFSMAAEAVMGDPETPVIPCMEYIYGISRVQVGGGRLGRGDGSLGAWVAKAVRDYGILQQGVHGKFDCTHYDQARCRDWGAHGPPRELIDIANKHKVGQITQLKTFNECVQALAQGYGVNICSGQGFSSRRDEQGFAAPRGHWSHSMGAIGYRLGARPGLFICNSWGTNYFTGGVYPEDMPRQGFWADKRVIESMLADDDSWAHSNVDGFPMKVLTW